MTNHPNRGPKGPQSNPTPAEIIAAREAAGLTQTAASGLIHSGLRTWQQWEAGDRRMHPAMWELFRIKIKVSCTEAGFVAWWGEKPRADDPIDFAAQSAWASACSWMMGG